MLIVLKQQGLAPGGLNFDCKVRGVHTGAPLQLNQLLGQQAHHVLFRHHGVWIVFALQVRRESTDIEDMFISHIGAMDTFARGLRNAAAIVQDGDIAKAVSKRYETFDDGFGVRRCWSPFSTRM